MPETNAEFDQTHSVRPIADPVKPFFEANGPEPSAPDVAAHSPIAQVSPGLPADEYTNRIRDARTAQLDAAEASLKTRHEAETQAMQKRHEFEAAELKRQRDALDAETKAIHAYADLWQRQSAELSTVSPSERDAMVHRHDRERIELEQETGYDVRAPLVGETTIPGFQSVPLRGHPWVRPVTVVRPLH